MSTVETPTQAMLSNHTTLRLGGPARGFVEAETTESLVAVVCEADQAGEPVLLLGGGSNLVVGDGGFDGTVVRVATMGWRLGEDGVVDVEAGQNWDEFVGGLVAAGIGGLECLSGIPGSVGATPIQNVGAYGCEISESLLSIEVYDRRRREVRTMTAAELGFAYRRSVLKGTDDGVVLSVRFRLPVDRLSAPVRYAELAGALGVQTGTRVPSALARAAVLQLRRAKGMVLDGTDHDTWSAGSFFTNPIVASSEVAEVLRRIIRAVGDEIQVPHYLAEGGTKFSAAWLIEHAGFAKGHQGPGGRVSLSTKHTLALTNRGSASTRDLLALASEVRDGVAARFGIDLHPEPLLINCAF